MSNIVPISIKSIREDGDIQYIDVDAQIGKPLLASLTSTTKIQCSNYWKIKILDHCGGKGICGQCLVSVPQDVYNRLDPPSKNEQIAISTNLAIPKKYETVIHFM